MRRRKSTHPSPPKKNRDLAEIKELLGPLTARYTDAQLDQLSHEMAMGASLLLGFYLEHRDDRPGPNTVFDSERDAR